MSSTRNTWNLSNKLSMISNKKVASTLLKKSRTPSSNQRNRTMLFITILMSCPEISTRWRKKTGGWREKLKSRRWPTRKKIRWSSNWMRKKRIRWNWKAIWRRSNRVVNNSMISSKRLNLHWDKHYLNSQNQNSMMIPRSEQTMSWVSISTTEM